MKIIVIASDVHTGGGKVVLNDFLGAAKDMKSIDFHVFVDGRFNSLPYNAQNISFGWSAAGQGWEGSGSRGIWPRFTA